mgnify:CR=1 FL=1
MWIFTRCMTALPQTASTLQSAVSAPHSSKASWLAHRCCEYAGLVLDEWPYVPLDSLCIQVCLEAVLGKARPSNHQTLDDAPVNMTHHRRQHLQTISTARGRDFILHAVEPSKERRRTDSQHTLRCADTTW